MHWVDDWLPETETSPAVQAVHVAPGALSHVLAGHVQFSMATAPTTDEAENGHAGHAVLAAFLYRLASHLHV